ncbi:hypothetical protein PTKU15_70660 [Paraburkholderia terrae]|nr:hypothetical protein PTKU15_70660 [Paraburkholderia terrae]
MTYAMLGIAAIVALMFGVALWRYRRSVIRKREIRWLGGSADCKDGVLKEWVR